MNFTNSSSESLFNTTDTVQSEQLTFLSDIVVTNSVILISLATIVIVLLIVSLIACLEELSLDEIGFQTFQLRHRRSGNANPAAYVDVGGNVVFLEDHNNNLIEV